MYGICKTTESDIKHLLNIISIYIIWSCLKPHNVFMIEFEQVYYEIILVRNLYYTTFFEK